MAKQTENPSFKVGVIGESKFDTEAMRRLLEKQYGARARFVAMPLRLAGGQLDGSKSSKMFSQAYQEKSPDLVVVFRDLDGPAGDAAKRRVREQFFEAVNSGMEQKGLLLLHVYTIEALLIAHVEVFQQRYGWRCRVPANPTTISKPDQFLRDASRNSRRSYEKAACADFMEQVDYTMLLKRCQYLQAFDQEFASRLPAA